MVDVCLSNTLELILCSALNRYVSENHIAFAHHILSKNRTPIFEFISKNFQGSVNYGSSSLVLLAIRDNFTGIDRVFNMNELTLCEPIGQYISYQSIKEEAMVFDIVGKTACFGL